MGVAGQDSGAVSASAESAGGTRAPPPDPSPQGEEGIGAPTPPPAPACSRAWPWSRGTRRSRSRPTRARCRSSCSRRTARSGPAAAAVDRDLAGAQPRGHLADLRLVGARDVGGEAVLGVVADLHRLVDRLVAEDRDHRPEDLFLGDGHVVGDVGEHRRLHIVALVQAFRTARRRR